MESMIGHDPFTEDLNDTIKELLFTAEDLHENIGELLNLHISLASHHSNHLLYVLTIFTVLFIPITFIGCAPKDTGNASFAPRQRVPKSAREG